MSIPSDAGRDDLCPEALARFLFVSQVLACMKRGGSRASCLREAAASTHITLAGELRCHAVRTIRRWLAAFEAGGLDALRPAGRPRTESSVVLPERLLDFLASEKAIDAAASIPEIVERARVLGIVSAEDPVSRTSAWRAARRMGLETRRRRRCKSAEADARRFAYPHRMDMVLCDGKHFRAGVTRARRVALFFLDDATRFGLDVAVGTSESTALFLRGLYEMTRRWGFADIFYLDRGPGFRSLDTALAVSHLGEKLVLGTAGYPEGHGAIERFNRTADEKVLRRLDGRPDVDASCGALEVRLRHYLHERYNLAGHEFLDDATPHERFFADARALRFPESDAELRSRFAVRDVRRVSSANTVPIDGIDYEMPRGHRGEDVEVCRRLLDGTVHVRHDGRVVEIRPVDLVANARDRRARGATPAEPPTTKLLRSAADLAFERDHAPIVDEEGGYDEPSGLEEDET